MSDFRIFRDLFLGFIKIHILYHADKGEIYGADFKEEIERHGYKISYGTLYPVFHKLAGSGLLKFELRNTDGKIRKYYTITALGRKFLKEVKQKVKELSSEIIME